MKTCNSLEEQSARTAWKVLLAGGLHCLLSTELPMGTEDRYLKKNPLEELAPLALKRLIQTNCSQALAASSEIKWPGTTAFQGIRLLWGRWMFPEDYSSKCCFSLVSNEYLKELPPDKITLLLGGLNQFRYTVSKRVYWILETSNS